MRWLGLAIVASFVAFLAPALAQSPAPQASSAASAEPVIEVTVGPFPDAVPTSAASGVAQPSASPTGTSPPVPHLRRGSRAKVLPPSPLPSATPEPVAMTPLPTATPSASPTPTSKPTYKPIFYHGIPIYPRAGFGLPSPTVQLVPTASAASPAALTTGVREKYYWNVPTPTVTPERTPVATPLPIPSRAPIRRSTPAAINDDVALDRSSSLIGGRWSCMSFGGTKLYHRYSRGEDGLSFDVATEFVLPNNKIARAREAYRFQHEALLWRVKLSDGSIVATAPPWIGLTWTFTGSARGDDRKTIGFRMIYTYLGQNVFRRDFERLDDVGSWNVYAGETCRRAFAQE